MVDSEQLKRGESIIQKFRAGGPEPESNPLKNQEEVFPDFRKMTLGHLFGDVFTRPGLGLRERVMITLALLIAEQYNDGMKRYIQVALNVGVTREEILEIIMHVAHYAGWHKGQIAIDAAKEVFSAKE